MEYVSCRGYWIARLLFKVVDGGWEIQRVELDRGRIRLVGWRDKNQCSTQTDQLYG